MKRIALLTIVALLATTAFGQMAGSSSKRYRNSRNNNYEYNRGYKGFVEIGGSVGSHTTRVNEYNLKESEILGTFGAYTSHGYQFNSYIFAGAGLGFEFANDAILPLFVEVRCNILNPNQHKYTPFVGARAGYNLPDNSDYGESSGFWGNLFAGYRFPLQKSLALNLSIGYQLGVYNQLEYDGSSGEHYNYLDQTCSIHVGLEF